MSVIVDDCSIDGEAQAYTWNAAPFCGADISTDALQANNLTLEEINEFPHEQKMLKTFSDLLARDCDQYKKDKTLRDKYFLMGYNVTFDGNFIRSLFVRNGDKFFGSRFWVPPVCIMHMAALKLLLHRDEMKGFRLVDVARFLDIPFNEEELHKALPHVTLVRNVFYKLLEMSDARGI
jgi:hypothetical protein